MGQPISAELSEALEGRGAVRHSRCTARPFSYEWEAHETDP